MKQTFLSFLVTLFCLQSVFAGSKAPYTGSRIFWDTATKKQIFSSGGYPRMIELQDGRLMAVCENKGIDIAFSSNKGNTWTAPTKIVMNGNIPECAPDLIQLSDGTILVAYNPRPSAPYSADRLFGIHLKRSTDNGKTWSDDVTVFDGNYDFRDGCWEPAFLEMPDGEVHLYFADETPYTNNDDQRIAICRSNDKGVTWTAPKTVAYHSGSRDGMPSAVILDNDSIALCFENPGWPGVGDFIPTIAVCAVKDNWKRFVPYPSTNRWQAINRDYVAAQVKGGAPYIRKLPWGETVLSHQTHYNGKYEMMVYVGDEKAQSFKAMSNPFKTSANEDYMWNSVSVIDTGVVVAVGNLVGGGVYMEKGYAVRMLQAPFAKTMIDGVQTRNEGYYGATAAQMILGMQNGMRFTGDFAYDEDSLYFTSRVSDADQVSSGSNGDGVTLFIDTKNSSSDQIISEGTFRFQFMANGKMRVAKGNGTSSWQWNAMSADTLGVNYKRGGTDRYYIVEAAIPWERLGFSKETRPNGTHMRVNVMLQNRSTSDATLNYEMLPDAKRDESWSWMDFYLQPHDASAVQDTKVSNKTNKVGIYDLQGRLIKQTNDNSFPLLRKRGAPVIVRQQHADGSTSTHKVMMK